VKHLMRTCRKKYYVEGFEKGVFGLRPWTRVKGRGEFIREKKTYGNIGEFRKNGKTNRHHNDPKPTWLKTRGSKVNGHSKSKAAKREQNVRSVRCWTEKKWGQYAQKGDISR